MKYEDIENANKQIRTLELERKDKKTGKVVKKEYAEVNQRIKAFRMCYPDGLISTTMLTSIEDALEKGVVIMRAVAYSGDGKVLGTGTAMEESSSSFINEHNFIENAETSAIGRCLGVVGFGIDTSVASYEEMKQVENNELHNRLQIQVQINKLMVAKKVTPDVIVDHFEKRSADMSDEELLEVVAWLEGMEEQK